MFPQISYDKQQCHKHDNPSLNSLWGYHGSLSSVVQVMARGAWQHQAITLTNADLSSTEHPGTYFTEISFKIQTSFMENVLENAVSEMVIILFRPQWVNLLVPTPYSTANGSTAWTWPPLSSYDLDLSQVKVITGERWSWSRFRLSVFIMDNYVELESTCPNGRN